MYKIGVDLGGTNIAVGVINENYEIIEDRKYNNISEIKEIHTISVGFPINFH